MAMYVTCNILPRSENELAVLFNNAKKKSTKIIFFLPCFLAGDPLSAESVQYNLDICSSIKP